ncbi:DUF4062 domain-containing protein [Sphingobium yanoikuyae]|uniref:DUF4062 domain-containing protein n=1 Tax=Sphingobium yanoikuyae TaxID=13690 RepID=A0A6M4G8N3_SPHYA|nr:DUF4062 domain-containing protein [Sphingobium yanoikuyae]QJR03491.1 DUF4062 domain-containing protein [Sphingobium yanoikuyae]
MHEKRYQVFISSTYEDLQDERRAVQDVVISMGDFPVQMESFPAADEDQFEFIKSLIDKCDYYVLIIAGRYGSVADDGLSYTHKEFLYAVERNVPVLVMLHGEIGKITADKIENTDAGRNRLKEFIAEAERKRLRKNWTNLGELKLAVYESLVLAKSTKPRTGWVRGDAVASLDALEELNQVRKENQEFREALGNLVVDIPLPTLPSASDSTTINLLPIISGNGFVQKQGSAATIEASWISFFPVIFSHIDISTSDWDGYYYYNIDYDKSCIAIGSAIAGDLVKEDTYGLFKIARKSLDRLIAYYTEAGLMRADNNGQSPFTTEAERVARRFYIAAALSTFKIVEGEISITDPALEVPF